jgi:hypothetical protein
VNVLKEIFDLTTFNGMHQIATWVVNLCEKFQIRFLDLRQTKPDPNRKITSKGIMLEYQNGLPQGFLSPWGYWQFLEPLVADDIFAVKELKKIISLEIIYPLPEKDPEKKSIYVVHKIPETQFVFPYPVLQKNTPKNTEIIKAWDNNLVFYRNMFLTSNQYRRYPD